MAVEPVDSWDAFLKDLYSKFSQYDVRKQIFSPDADDDTNQVKLLITPDIVMKDATDVEAFLKSIKSLNVIGVEEISSRPITGSRIRELNEVLDSTLRSEIRASCPDSETLVVTGDFISFSQIVDQDDHLIYKCDEYASQPKNINIFGFNSVFMDARFNVSKSGVQQLLIVAPKVQAHGYPLINLSGAGGKLQDPIYPKRYNNVDGPYAKPGLPGESGGNLLVLSGEKLIGEDLLIINTSGGIGGTGQDASDSYDFNIDPYHLCEKNFPYSGPCPPKDFVQAMGNIQIEPKVGYKCTWKIEPLANDTSIHTFTFDQASVTDGDNDDYFTYPGKGGLGGEPGRAAVFQLSTFEKSELFVSGKREVSGFDGEAGLKNKNPKNLEQSDHGTKLTIYINQGTNCRHNLIKENPSYNDAYESGPKKNNQMDHKSIKISTDYKRYLIENIGNEDIIFRKNVAMEFADKLDEIQIRRDPSSFEVLYEVYAELAKLELLIDAKKHENFIPFYEVLLAKVEKMYKDNKMKDSQKRIAGSFYTAILSRIHNLRYFSESNLIIDIDRYLKTVLKTIKDFENIHNEVDRLKVLDGKLKKIEDKRKGYNKYQDEKIKQVDQLIEQMLVEIDVIGGKINDEIDKLFKEVEDLQTKGKKFVDDLEKQKKKLKNKMIFKGILAWYKSAAQFLKFLGPIGAAAGMAVEVGANVIDGVFLSDDDTVKGPPKLPKGIEMVSKTEKELKEHEKSSLRTFLDTALKESEKFKKDLGGMAGKLEKLNKDSNLADSFDRARQLKIDGKNIISSTKKSLAGTGSKALKSLGKLEEMSSLEPPFLAVYRTVTEYQDKIEQVDLYIDQGKQQLKQLEDYNRFLHDTMAPKLNDMVKDLKKTEEALKGQSKAVLMVTKWQISKTLKEMDRQIQEIMDGFEAKEKISRQLRDMQDVMVTLIELFTEIENIQERKRLVSHITDLSVITTGEGIDRNQEIINRLESSIISSIVLQQYHGAINAVKQMVFPLADFFLGPHYLPAALQAETNDTNALAALAAKRVEDLKAKIGLYRSSVTKLDHCMGIGPFDSTHRATRPFFVWKNANHSEVISDLLSGKEVELKSDIMQTLTDRFSAVKFTDIGLNFKTNNKEDQDDINERLKSYAIHMTHLGDSYYEYSDKIYRISTASQYLWHYLERNRDNSPIHVGGVYRKIQSGDFMLSPYATWKVHLEYLYNNPVGLVDDKLDKFINKTDIELVGEGSYATNTSDKCSEMELDRYYQAMDVSEFLGSKSLMTPKNSPSSVAGSTIRKKRDIAYTFDEKIEEGELHDDHTPSYASSSASPSMSSPLNSFCGWLNTQSIAFALSLSAMPISLPHIGYKRLFGSDAVDSESSPPKSRESVIIEEIFEDDEEEYHDALDNLESIVIGELPSEIEDLVPQRYLNHNKDDSSYSHSLGLPSPFENVESSHPVDHMNGSGLMVLADLLSRTFTGEKYRQRLYIDPAQERAQEVHYLRQRVYEALEDMNSIYGNNDNSFSLSS